MLIWNGPSLARVEAGLGGWHLCAYSVSFGKSAGDGILRGWSGLSWF